MTSVKPNPVQKRPTRPNDRTKGTSPRSGGGSIKPPTGRSDPKPRAAKASSHFEKSGFDDPRTRTRGGSGGSGGGSVTGHPGKVSKS